MDHQETKTVIKLGAPILAARALPSLKGAGQIHVGVASTAARIVGLASATPARHYTQREMLDVFGFQGDTFAESIFERSNIVSRPMILEPEDFQHTGDPYFQYRKSQAGCLDLAAAAIGRALAQAGLALADVDCLALATTSQLHMPCLTSLLVSRLGLRRDVDQFNLLGHGCSAAVPLLDLAEGYLRRNPARVVLAVAVDIGSVMLQPADPTHKGAVVANSLFSDAGAALVLQGAASPGTGGGIALVDSTSFQGAPETVDSAVYDMAPNGARKSVLHKELPARSAGVVALAIDGLLARNGLTRADIDHWAFHPGGRAILEGLQGVLGLSDEQLAPSLEVLRTVGNAGAPTCLLSLEKVAAARARPGDWGLLVCVGPGLIAAGALVRWA
ncbi:MAG: chalcone and stilbene synthase domain protein [Cyanobacteria bacterium RYN_339]|nr:chalcone and stilbene synthase domain protein [Cyanobacteria bacterium RYN_339]